MITRSYLIPAASLLLAVSFLPVVRADETADAKKAIEDSYAKITAASNKYDKNTVLSFYAPNYIEVGKNGKETTLAEVKARMPRLFSFIRAAKMQSNVTTVIKKISLKGNEAAVTAEAKGSGTMTHPRTHKTISQSVNALFEDVWVKSGTRWLMKRHHALSHERR